VDECQSWGNVLHDLASAQDAQSHRTIALDPCSLHWLKFFEPRNQKIELMLGSLENLLSFDCDATFQKWATRGKGSVVPLTVADL